MTATFSQQFTTLGTQVPQKLLALHTEIGSSKYCDPAASTASLRLNSSASARTSRKLATSLDFDRSWQLTPGTSCIQPIHQSPSCLSTAVYSVFISLVYCKATVRTSKQIGSEIQLCVSPCRNLLPDIARWNERSIFRRPLACPVATIGTFGVSLSGQAVFVHQVVERRSRHAQHLGGAGYFAERLH